MLTSHVRPLDFLLPEELEAGEPPEARGLARDEVRLLVSSYTDNRIEHAQFRQIPQFLAPGDVVVINTSGTMNAALEAIGADGTRYELHLSTHLPADLWVVEVRIPDEHGTKPYYGMREGEVLRLAENGTAALLLPYLPEQRVQDRSQKRLWIATLHLPMSWQEYLKSYGFPIRYRYVRNAWPIEYYQTVYATEVGSAEMPSAGRAFTPELITRLVALGVQVLPLLLHTGVASLEAHEPPYEEYYRVPEETAQGVNAARQAGRRVIAVGTTVVRALETVTTPDGVTHPGEGWTQTIITPERGVRAVHGLLTGLHEPQASHLLMLEAFAPREHLKLVYAEALQKKYLWHEFGDLHLLLP